jgi:hypothetical protein
MVKPHNTPINVTGLGKGIYFLEFSGTKTMTKTFAKK